MRIKGKPHISIIRDENGIPKVVGKDLNDLLFGLGYCHAMDRGIQLMLMQTLGKGEACLKLQDTNEMFEIDTFFRRFNFCGNTAAEIEKFTPTEKEQLQAYCDGINQRFAEKKPWELTKLIGFKSFHWEIQDIIMMTRMAGFLTLAQSQGEIELLFIELVQNKIPKKLLGELFPGILGNYDEEVISEITLPSKIIPDSVKWHSSANPLMASNNWVVNGDRSASGCPILANDPHLEVNRLPAVWYEIALESDDNFIMGATMPGISAVLIGRNKNVSWGATYTFMDAMDYWMEDCKGGKYLKDGKHHVFTIREERIERKKNGEQFVTFYENEHGVLLGNPNKDGRYLSVSWSASTGGAQSLKQGLLLTEINNTKDAMNCLGRLEMSFNWVIADTAGNIGYQMSGLLPKRNKNYSGFTPIPGWESDNDWSGFYSFDQLPQLYNPENGYIVTANEDLSEYGSVNPHTITMGNYRSDRIKALLTNKQKISVADMKKMHMDVYSLQAELFLPLFEPHLDDSANSQLLRNWDKKYTADSLGASVFENIYHAYLMEVFGAVFGEEVMTHLLEETGYITDFYGNFDRILLSEHSSWFLDRSRADILNISVQQGLKMELKKWGEHNELSFTNILVGDQLPRFIGFNKGPIGLQGNRATIHQGQIYRNNNRITSFAPSYRLIADLSEKHIETSLPGGPSDRRFSKLYTNDLQNWIEGNYKTLKT